MLGSDQICLSTPDQRSRETDTLNDRPARPRSKGYLFVINTNYIHFGAGPQTLKLKGIAANHFTQILGFDLKIVTQLSHPQIQLDLGKNLN